MQCLKKYAICFCELVKLFCLLSKLNDKYIDFFVFWKYKNKAKQEIKYFFIKFVYHFIRKLKVFYKYFKVSYRAITLL